MLTGGSTRFPNFSERLQRELRALVPSEFELGLTAAADPLNAAWRGGSLYAAAESFPSQTVTLGVGLALGFGFGFGFGLGLGQRRASPHTRRRAQSTRSMATHSADGGSSRDRQVPPEGVTRSGARQPRVTTNGEPARSDPELESARAISR